MASFDPLASSQVTVDPALKPKPSKELAVRRQQLIEMFMNQGFDQPTAEREADRYLADYPVVTGQQVAAPAPQPEPAPAAPETGPMQSAPVAPVNLGSTWGGARPFASEEDRDNYQKRRKLTRGEIIELKAQGATEAEIRQMQMSQQDIDMLDSGEYGAGQGWVPVYDPLTGRQTFKQRAPAPKPMIGGGHIVDGLPLAMGGSEAVTGQRRIGERVDNRELQADLRNPELERLGYQIVRWDGPNGPEYIYHMNRPDDAGGVSPQRAAQLEKYDKVKERQQLQRIAGSAGVPIADARAAMKAGGMDAVRDMAADQRTKSQQDRMKRFQAQIQLGGGRLSPQAIQLETLLNGMNPEQRQRALQYMAPGGALAAQVDARNLEAAAGLARNAVVGVLGQAGGNNPAAQAAVEAGLPLDQQVQLTRDRNGGTLPANSPAGVALLKQIENDVIGPFATEAEVDQAVRQAVAAGIPLADAEAHFAPRRWKKKPAAADAPGEEPAKPRVPGRGGSRTRPRKPGDARPRE
jgi:hypothetical protein